MSSDPVVSTDTAASQLLQSLQQLRWTAAPFLESVDLFKVARKTEGHAA
jgi:hypothetical protein